MADGDFPYPTSNLGLKYIAAGISETEELHACCSSTNVLAGGLKSPYCPGANKAARLTNLQTDKQQSYFKAYNPVFVPGNANSGASHIFYDSTTVYPDDFPYEGAILDLTILMNPTQFWAVGTDVELDYIEVTNITNEILTGTGDDRYLKYNSARIQVGDKIYANAGNTAFEYGWIYQYNEQMTPGTNEMVRMYFKFKMKDYQLSAETYASLYLYYIDD